MNKRLRICSYKVSQFLISAILLLIVFSSSVSAQNSGDAQSRQSQQKLPLHFVIQHSWSKPVIDAGTPGTEDNKFGFEGGVVEKIGLTYYLLTNELYGEPLYTRIRSAVWTSQNAIQWTRSGTLFHVDWAVPGVAHLWGPMAVFNAADDRWNLFPVSTPAGASASEIARYVSQSPGREGLAGPYKVAETILTGDRKTQAWEDAAGIVSFYPYQVGDSWCAFYGSHWMVGLVQAPNLSGPWTRVPEVNPVQVEPVFIENPLVSRIGKWDVAVYGGGQDNRNKPGNYQPNGHYCGYTCSLDGIHWLRGGRIPVQQFGYGKWADDIRTPLCLISEGHGLYRMLCTARNGGYRLGPSGGGKCLPDSTGPFVWLPCG